MDLKIKKLSDIPVIKEAVTPQGGCSTSGCGSANDPTPELPQAIREKIQDHPCYSEEAHHHFARMHVAVAPACNIQCHYCNRKYDCANESRPGVVSEVLKPHQAVKKALAVAASIPEMTVVGIAGPGDGLANPTRTFQTFRGIREQADDIKLCLSTNGMALPEHVEELAALGVDHITITINSIDPEVGARIHPWVIWNKKRVFGVEGARLLIQQQQKGLEMLVERGVLVKVNSVMIPGINDEHLKEVSRVVKAKGAFMHNIMPLISEPEHGTYFGLNGQRGPTQAELTALRDACGTDMKMMRHCRQCRADAVGRLGEDRGAEFTADRIDELEVDYPAARERRDQVQAAIRESMGAKRLASTARAPVASATGKAASRPVLMAVATQGGGVINQHFGHAREFLVYRASPEGVRFEGHRRADLYCSGPDECGDREQVMASTLRSLEDCEVLLCSRIGIEPWSTLEAAGITPNPNHAMEPIEDAILAVYQEMMESGQLAPVEEGSNSLMAEVS
ncbi:nitrogenase cofactor biosynthesis protein NifB [Ectothiorhodospira haloalkaliphila]|uniref:nitrogenase cofactor biosynthesis protein NifB n=1 Tax=Ectothiorhodospira haloalkaliphila TaxID=421628 RepID=UPI001EE89725|nr:nitrogenase cofactor biosynthesis protein NifB [Ectothiorhodospira haloalkaliphila]MCG5525307.1 nitrogenase cofactor biosynthesis protein NifB [Ectothiorhodospira haloalkaliphila]